MARIEIRDGSLWTKHIADDPQLRRKLEALQPGQRVWLRIDGTAGWCFEKMRSGPNGPMPGLKPIEETRDRWRQRYYPARAGQTCDISLEKIEDLGSPSATSTPGEPTASTWSDATETERAAAWEAFKALTKAGWRSDVQPSGESRADLHER